MVTPSVTLETTELSFPSRIEAVNEAAAAVSEFMNRLGIGEDVAFGVDMAVREAVTNAVIHGNKLNDAKVVEIRQRWHQGAHDQETITILICDWRSPRTSLRPGRSKIKNPHRKSLKEIAENG